MINVTKMEGNFYHWFDPDTGYGGYVDNLLWFDNPHILEGILSIDELEEAAQQK